MFIATDSELDGVDQSDMLLTPNGASAREEVVIQIHDSVVFSTPQYSNMSAAIRFSQM